MAGADDSRLRPRMLIGDPERERLTAILRDHYAEGRLTLDELRRRAEIVLAATYQDEADQALAGLPVISPGTAVTARSRRQGLLSRRGHAESALPGPDWVATAERFRDPSSGLIMRVWIDPVDGSRHYVPDDNS
ncbi:MAG TPA: DUF1707 domain-containing protein [Trebonia sp.]